jgi:hypothetical protein
MGCDIPAKEENHPAMARAASHWLDRRRLTGQWLPGKTKARREMRPVLSQWPVRQSP